MVDTGFTIQAQSRLSYFFKVIKNRLDLQLKWNLRNAWRWVARSVNPSEMISHKDEELGTAIASTLEEAVLMYSI
jgi:hypothetical protein